MTGDRPWRAKRKYVPPSRNDNGNEGGNSVLWVAVAFVVGFFYFDIWSWFFPKQPVTEIECPAYATRDPTGPKPCESATLQLGKNESYNHTEGGESIQCTRNARVWSECPADKPVVVNKCPEYKENPKPADILPTFQTVGKKWVRPDEYHLDENDCKIPNEWTSEVIPVKDKPPATEPSTLSCTMTDLDGFIRTGEKCSLTSAILKKEQGLAHIKEGNLQWHYWEDKATGKMCEAQQEGQGTNHPIVRCATKDHWGQVLKWKSPARHRAREGRIEPHHHPELRDLVGAPNEKAVYDPALGQYFYPTLGGKLSDQALPHKRRDWVGRIDRKVPEDDGYAPIG